MIAEVVKWNNGLILCPFSTRRIHAQRAECKMDTFCGAEIVLLRIHPKKNSAAHEVGSRACNGWVLFSYPSQNLSQSNAFARFNYSANGNS